MAGLDAYLRHLEKDDELHVLLRGHVYVEAALIQLIESKLANPQALKVAGLNFPLKVRLATALGLLSGDVAMLCKRLNDLRNRVAHQLDKELTHEDLDVLVDIIVERIGVNRSAFLGITMTAIGDNRTNTDNGIRDFSVTDTLRVILSFALDMIAPHRSANGKAGGGANYLGHLLSSGIEKSKKRSLDS